MPSDFDLRFKNWVRWCLARGFHRNQAGSIEGNYRSGQIWEEAYVREGEIDVVDAEVVNRAYARLAAYPRRVIKVLYFRAFWRPQWQAQKLGCRMVDLPALGHEARRLLAVQVDLLDKKDNTARTVKSVRALVGAIFASRTDAGLTA